MGPAPALDRRRGEIARAESLSRAERACEEACRLHSSACLGASDALTAMLDPAREDCADLAMDCAYASSAAARALRHLVVSDCDAAMMLVAACRQLAGRCADACEKHATQAPALVECGRVSRDCAAACEALLAVLRAQVTVHREPTFGRRSTDTCVGGAGELADASRP